MPLASHETCWTSFARTVSGQASTKPGCDNLVMVRGTWSCRCANRTSKERRRVAIEWCRPGASSRLNHPRGLEKARVLPRRGSRFPLHDVRVKGLSGCHLPIGAHCRLECSKILPSPVSNCDISCAPWGDAVNRDSPGAVESGVSSVATAWHPRRQPVWAKSKLSHSSKEYLLTTL